MSATPTLARRALARLPGSRWRSRTAGQVMVFTASNGLVSLLGAVSKALLARTLSVTSFGALSFATSFLQFAALLFEFGIFVPASRMAARARGVERREVIGAAIVAYLPVGVAFAAAMFGVSFFVDSVFAVEVGHALRVTAPLCLAYPFVLVGLQLAQGSDRLHVYSVTTVFGQALFVVVLAVIVAADWGMSTASALALRGGATLAGAVVLAVWLRPVFRDVRRYVRALFAEAREWGTKVYYGRVLSVGTYNLDVIILGALTDAKSVAFYTLAGAVGYALGLPVTGLSSALFPRMVGAGGLRREWLGLAVGFGALGVAAAWILGPPFISLLFGDSYEDASRYVVPLTLAQSIRGVTTIYNSYFSAQAAGDELRRAAIVLTASNMVLNFALIPPFGAAGAAWASVLALVANLWMHWLGYRGLRARAA